MLSHQIAYSPYLQQSNHIFNVFICILYKCKVFILDWYTNYYYQYILKKYQIMECDAKYYKDLIQIIFQIYRYI